MPILNRKNRIADVLRILRKAGITQVRIIPDCNLQDTPYILVPHKYTRELRSNLAKARKRQRA